MTEQAISVKQHILFIRGEKVMLDAHLAMLYGVETKVLLQAVKRNLDRFPEDFMFQLSDEEQKILRSQNVTSSWGGRRYHPYVFTEQGIAMLSSVLRSTQAVNVNIEIMRTFVRLRKELETNQKLKKKLDELEQKYDTKFQVIFNALRQMMSSTETSEKRSIGFAPWPK